MALPRVTDVEQLKKKVRRLAAGQVLQGETAEACLDLGRLQGCRVRIAAGYGAMAKVPQSSPRDRLFWILDGFVEVYDGDGEMSRFSQGESYVLAAGAAYRLVFPQLTVYLSVESEESR